MRPKIIRVLVILLLVGSLTVNVILDRKLGLLAELWGQVKYRMAPIPAVDLNTPLAPLPSPAMALDESVDTAEELEAWQTAGRAKLGALLGVKPFPGGIAHRVVDEKQVGSVTRRLLCIEMPDGMEVPAFLLTPAAASQASPRPAVVVVPGHSSGIINTAGLLADYQESVGLKLAEAGFVVLTVERRGWGYLYHVGPEGQAISGRGLSGQALLVGSCMVSQDVADLRVAMDVLADRPDVDADRIAVFGFSSGGVPALALAILDDQIRAVGLSSCVMSFRDACRYQQGDPATIVPGLGLWLEMSDMLALAAPRPVLVQWGELDTDRASYSASLTPSSKPTIEAARRAWALTGAETRLEMHVTPSVGHGVDPAVTVDFFTRVLAESDATSEPGAPRPPAL